MEGETEKNWSEKVKDLVESGDTDAAIFLLESLITKLESPKSRDSNPQLTSVLQELAKLYSSKALSLKSDDALSPASSRVYGVHCSTSNEPIDSGDSDLFTKSSPHHVSVQGASSDDDWEAIADRAPDELLSPQCLPEVSKLSLGEPEVKKKVPNRRGRGTFTYKKQGMYSDELMNNSTASDTSDEVVLDKSEKISEAKTLYGTHHVLVLDGFHPSTTTTDLERLFEDFRDRGFSIHWVNDTLALAVFRTPSIALEACSSKNCFFKVRMLEEDDPIMSSISIKDLDPPRQRPKTSARTAQRLIAKELGVKLPSSFGSRELKKQEDDRRNRIVTRQNLRGEAWGSDDII